MGSFFFVFGGTLTSKVSECQSQNKSEIRNMIHADNIRNICEQTVASVSYSYFICIYLQ